MKALLLGLGTMISGYIISSLFSGLGTSISYMTYVNACTNAVLFLSGVVSIWGFLILQELKRREK